jgi:type IV secretory pathway TrbD component
MDEDRPSLPLFQSLTQPILMAGVPRTFFILNGMTGVILTIPLQLFYIGIPLAIILHTIAAWFTRRDPHFFEILMRHLRQPHFWT